MALVKGGKRVENAFVSVRDAADLPADGAVIVPLDLWQSKRDALLARGEPLGVRLASDEHPESIRDDVDDFQVIALEFPTFRDGRAYSYARLLRERYGFEGELRAVGDVLLEQLHYMDRVGFDAFEIPAESAVDDWVTACNDLQVWYQPTNDGRDTAMDRRRRG